jgi:hypothetical protein
MWPYKILMSSAGAMVARTCTGEGGCGSDWRLAAERAGRGVGARRKG